MLYFIIYMIQVLPTLADIAFGICVLSSVCLLILCIGYLIEDSLPPKFPRVIKMLGITCCISTLLALFTPNRTTLYQMSAIYLGKQVNKSIQLDAKIQKISTIVDLQLDKTIKDLTSDN